MVPKFIKLTQPILDYYIKDPRNLVSDPERDFKLSVIAEEKHNSESPTRTGGSSPLKQNQEVILETNDSIFLIILFTIG